MSITSTDMQHPTTSAVYLLVNHDPDTSNPMSEIKTIHRFTDLNTKRPNVRLINATLSRLTAQKHIPVFHVSFCLLWSNFVRFQNQSSSVGADTGFLFFVFLLENVRFDLTTVFIVRFEKENKLAIRSEILYTAQNVFWEYSCRYHFKFLNVKNEMRR